MNTHAHETAQAPIKPSAEDIRRLASSELSSASRVGYTALLLVALTMTTVTGALLVTEVGLPARTQLALALTTLIGSSWVALAVWVLARRRVLLGRHRVIAAWMGVVYSGVFGAGAFALGYWGGAGQSAYLAAALQGGLFALGIVLLIRARNTFAALAARRRVLEEEMRRLSVR